MGVLFRAFQSLSATKVQHLHPGTVLHFLRYGTWTDAVAVIFGLAKVGKRIFSHFFCGGVLPTMRKRRDSRLKPSPRGPRAELSWAVTAGPKRSVRLSLLLPPGWAREPFRSRMLARGECGIWHWHRTGADSKERAIGARTLASQICRPGPTLFIVSRLGVVRGFLRFSVRVDSSSGRCARTAMVRRASTASPCTYGRWPWNA